MSTVDIHLSHDCTCQGMSQTAFMLIAAGTPVLDNPISDKGRCPRLSKVLGCKPILKTVQLATCMVCVHSYSSLTISGSK